MFTAEHLIWMGICAVIIAVLSYLSLKNHYPLQKACRIMCCICAFSETAKIYYSMKDGALGGMYMDPDSLPFHLCSMMLFMVLYITFGKDGKLKDTLIDFIAGLGPAGGFLAILIPTMGTSFKTIDAYQIFIYHAGIMWFSFYLMFSGTAKLGWAAFKRNLTLILCLVWAMFYINSIFSVYNSNFLFMVRPPVDGLPILNLDHGWYVYFLTILGLGIVGVFLLHLPWILKERREKNA